MVPPLTSAVCGCRAAPSRRLWTRSQLTRGCSASSALGRARLLRLSPGRREAVPAADHLQTSSRTPAATGRGRGRPAGPARTDRGRPSRPSPASATSCWASTSRQLIGTRIASTRPGGHLARQARPVRAGRRPSWGSAGPCCSPTRWPARPTRCSPRATLPGDSTWQTRSTAPMSMPSSSDAVATTAGSRPSFRRLLGRCRTSSATLPWWADCAEHSRCRVARQALPGRSSAVIARSTERRLLAKTMVERCSRISRRQQPVDRRPDRALRQRPELRSTGLTTRRSRSLRSPASTIVDRPRLERVGRRRPARAAEVAGHLVQRPLRRRQADADEARRVERLQPLQQQRQEDAALVGAEGVNLVDDAVGDAAQGVAPGTSAAGAAIRAW